MSDFLVGDRLRKPDRWGLDPGDVAPEWRWYWDALVCAVPFWDKMGDGSLGQNREDTLQAFPSNYSIATTNTDPRVVTPAGIGNRMADQATTVQFLVSPTIDIGLTGAFSAFVYTYQSGSDNWSAGASNKGFFRTNGGGGTNFFILNGLATGLWCRMDGSNVFQTTNMSYSQGFNSLGVSMLSGSRAIGLHNGEVLADTTTSQTFGAAGANRNITVFGTQFGAELSGVWLHAAFFDRFLSIEQHQQLARDPFGPFRMAEDVGFFSPLQAITSTADLTIPALSISATGEQPHEGTGILTVPLLEIAGVGEQPHEGTADLTIPALSIAATATHGDAAAVVAGRYRRRYTLPDGRRVEATQEEIQAILAQYVRAQKADSAPPELPISVVEIDSADETLPEPAPSTLMAPLLSLAEEVGPELVMEITDDLTREEAKTLGRLIEQIQDDEIALQLILQGSPIEPRDYASEALRTYYPDRLDAGPSAKED